MTEQALESAYEREDLFTGVEAVAEALRLANVDVVAAYPIRPYTGVMDKVSKMIADGKLDAEYIIADGEHSQFEIGKHATSVGARSFVGSSGTGWMYGFEALVVTATDRLPLVALVGNRALDDPGAFGVEHNDAMALRDMGWLIPFASTAQEALDTTLIAYKVGENPKVRLPVSVSLDGAFLTHSQHMVKIPKQDVVDKFLPPLDLGNHRLHPDNPISIAPQVNEDWVMEIRRQIWEAAERSKGVIEDAYKEFNEVFGHRYDNPFIEEYMTEDADVVLVGVGAFNQAGRTTAKRLREKGEKVGFVRLRWFRPFADDVVRESLSKFDAVGIVDRDVSYVSPDRGGILFNDVRSSLYRAKNRPNIVNFIAGLGGREISISDAKRMFEITQEAAKKEPEKVVHWIGVRE